MLFYWFWSGHHLLVFTGGYVMAYLIRYFNGSLYNRVGKRYWGYWWGLYGFGALSLIVAWNTFHDSSEPNVWFLFAGFLFRFIYRAEDE